MARDPFSAWILNNKDASGAEIVKIFDVLYIHLRLENDDDLYVTRYGLPYVDLLKPGNYLLDKEWFDSHSLRLSGTSCTYRVTTKKIDEKSKDLVLKWNRMGEDVPGGGETDLIRFAEFNSPFEEFALVMELRNTRFESMGRIITQKPMAIYVPKEHVELWQTGRKEYVIQSKIKTHKEVKLEMFRQYLVIYEWVKGIDAAQASLQGILPEAQMKDLCVRVEKEMAGKGYLVRDRKANHIIIKPRKGGTLLKNIEGNILYAMVDFELLERTPEREEYLHRIKRLNYLKRQRDRFAFDSGSDMPPNLRHVTVFGVDYIHGRAESTRGALWVVGHDPYLFDYFLPERWEKTPRTRLSSYSEIFHTVTKDNIHLVWKVTRTGMIPDVDPYNEDEQRIIEYGFNSPFEEISIACDLGKKGIRTIYPRAIYMTGDKIKVSDDFSDQSRYENHKNLLNDDGKPILRRDRDYFIIWGYWTGPDEKLAVLDGDYYTGINALNAYRKGMLQIGDYLTLMNRVKSRLLACGIEDLNLRGSHLLLSLDSGGSFIMDDENLPDARICDFELLRRMK